jgi:hypothetical protein
MSSSSPYGPQTETQDLGTLIQCPAFRQLIPYEDCNDRCPHFLEQEIEREVKPFHPMKVPTKLCRFPRQQPVVEYGRIVREA